VVGRGPADVDPQVLTVAPTQLRQGLCECREAGLKFLIVRGRGHQYAYAPHAVAPLCTRGKRPHRCRSTEERDELATSHCRP
jgi:hypothetical protein